LKETLLKPTQMMKNGLSGFRYQNGGTLGAEWMKAP